MLHSVDYVLGLGGVILLGVMSLPQGAKGEEKASDTLRANRVELSGSKCQATMAVAEDGRISLHIRKTGGGMALIEISDKVLFRLQNKAGQYYQMRVDPKIGSSVLLKGLNHGIAMHANETGCGLAMGDPKGVPVWGLGKAPNNNIHGHLNHAGKVILRLRCSMLEMFDHKQKHMFSMGVGPGFERGIAINDKNGVASWSAVVGPKWAGTRIGSQSWGFLDNLWVDEDSQLHRKLGPGVGQ